VVELREAHGGQAAREKAYVFVSEELKLWLVERSKTMIV
jgi:hypothetical protein